MKRIHQESIWAAILALALFAATGCNKSGSNAAGGDTIPVGEYASLTGSEATFGTSSDEGTRLAIEEINAAGGVLGRKIDLVTEDTLSKPGESGTVVTKLITRDNVVAVLGEVASSRSLEAAPICQQNKIPMISPSSTNPDVTRTGDYIFRVCFIDPFQGTVMANFATKTLHAKNVAILKDVQSDYSKGLAEFFRKQFLANGGQVPVELDYNSGDKDFKSQLTTIKASNPDAIFVPGYYTECALICVQARELGITVPLMGGDGWESSKLFEIGGDAVNGCYLSTHYSASVGTDLSKKFVADYAKRWNGKTPDALAACGYDSALVLADAIKRAGTTAEPQLRDAIAATKNFPAVTGTITINENRDATKSAVILKVEDGKYKYLETVGQVLK